MTRPTIRVLIVDDSEAFLESAVAFLSQRTDLELAGRTTSAAEAVDIVRRLHVDLVLMDVAMAGMDGLEATRRIKKRAAAPKVVVLTLHDGPEYREAARSAGADVFLPKSEVGSRIDAVLDALFAGNGGTSRVL